MNDVSRMVYEGWKAQKLGEFEVRGADDPLGWDGWVIGREPAVKVPRWKFILRELRWRVPHAWRVLIHGDCDGY